MQHIDLKLTIIVFFEQKLDFAAVVGMGLIIAGVVVLRLYSEASVE